jgi:hypothetical protein
MPAEFRINEPGTNPRKGARILLRKDWLVGAIRASLMLRSADARSGSSPRRAKGLRGVEAVRRMASR